MKVIKAPQKLEFEGQSVFLAGSIEMGKAVDWQTEITNYLSDMDVTVLNPRRDDWDSSWEQKITNPQFAEQVNWELDALDKATVIALYFDPKTMSPISLLELGMFASTRKVIVCCPEGFWRKGNVDIVCKRNNLQQVNTLEELKAAVKQDLEARVPEKFDSLDIYLRKNNEIVGLHAYGHAWPSEYDVQELDGTLTRNTSNFTAYEQWGNEYNEKFEMIGRGSFRVFGDIEETAKEFEADGWTRFERQT
jgi:hypothetical protein